MAGSLTAQDQVLVLMSEYTSLRAEILQRGSWAIQMSTVAGTMTVAIFGFMFVSGAHVTGLFMLLCTALLLCVGLLYDYRDIRAVVVRLRIVEQMINQLAGQELLNWELRSGLLTVGHLQRLRTVFVRAPGTQ